MNESLLPADIYVVINKSLLTEYDKDTLMMLYMPIIGHTAVSLYLTLYTELKVGSFVSPQLKHHHLMSSMSLKLSEIKDARIKLESIGLLKTYIHSNSINSYVYELYSPLSASEIFNHPIFNIVLYNNVGKEEYERLKDYFTMPSINLKDYKDITTPFDIGFKSVSYTEFELNNKDIIKKDSLRLTYELDFDFDLLVSSINNSFFNPKSLNKTMKDLIINLSFLYNFNVMTMAEIIKTCINEKGNIDKELLRKNARKFYQYNNDNRLPSLIYNNQPIYARSAVGDNSNKGKMVRIFETTSPYEFLRGRQKGVKPTERDLQILESLLIDFKLNPAVVNVLVDYVLKTQNNKLIKNYIETIASQWKRMNVETALEAMDAAVSEHNKLSKKKNSVSKKEESVPIWFDSEQDFGEVSEEDKKELEELLKEFR